MLIMLLQIGIISEYMVGIIRNAIAYLLYMPDRRLIFLCRGRCGATHKKGEMLMDDSNNQVSLERLLTPAQYAALTGRTVQAVAHDRCRGCGPDFVRIGRKVYYHPATVRAFFEQHQVRSTAQPEA